MKTYKQLLAEIRGKDDPALTKKIHGDTIRHLEQLIRKTKDKALKRKYQLSHALLKRQLFQLGHAA